MLLAIPVTSLSPRGNANCSYMRWYAHSKLAAIAYTGTIPDGLRDMSIMSFVEQDAVAT